MNQEVWRPIPGFFFYEVSNMGNVRRVNGGSYHIIKPSTDPKGYRTVNLCEYGKLVGKKIHTIVMLAFVGERPCNMEVCHNDGDPGNNKLENLRYDTHINNMQDAIVQGKKVGITFLQKEQIVQDRLAGLSTKSIAEKHKTSHVTIRKVLIEKGLADYSPDGQKAMNIREEYASGRVSYNDLMKKYKLTRSAISRIINGKRHLKAGGPTKNDHA